MREHNNLTLFLTKAYNDEDVDLTKYLISFRA
jgi:hypothetical protein